MSIHQKIGKKIRLARKHAGMTQSQLAKKLGKTGAAIAYLEQGKRRISTDVLTLVARFTVKPLSFFYEDDDDSGQMLKTQLSDLRGHLDGIKTLLDEAEKNKKSAENKLQLFRALLDQSNDHIAIWDPDTGRALDCNEKTCSGLGYTREEFLKKSIFDIETGIPNLAAWKESVKEAKKKRSFVLPTNAVTKKGKITPMEVSVRYVALDDAAYMVVIARGLQERKEYEEMAVQHFKVNRDFLESFSIGVFFSDIRGSITEVNSVIWDILEIPPDIRSETDFSPLQETLKMAGVCELSRQSLETLKEVVKTFHFVSPWKKSLSISVRMIPIKYLGYVMGVQGLIEPVKGKGMKS